MDQTGTALTEKKPLAKKYAGGFNGSGSVSLYFIQDEIAGGMLFTPAPMGIIKKGHP